MIAQKNTRWEVFQLLGLLAIGKLVVLLAVFWFDRSPGFLQVMNTHLDSWVFELIATRGYIQLTNYAFSPFYPALIRGLDFVIPRAWVSGFIITNILSFIFPLILYRTFGYRTALMAAIFPTYLVFTTIAYSDVIALLFLALSIFFIMRERIIASSVAVSLAILDFFQMAWTLPAYMYAVLKKKRVGSLAFAIIPCLTAVFIFLWFRIETGNWLSYFSIESNAWGVHFTTPIAQAESLLSVQWKTFGVTVPPAYWLVRNLIFELFYLVGAFLILKTSGKHKVFLFLYSLLVIVPLLLIGGTPSLSVPRLLLPAFPVFYAYAAIIRRDKYYWGYVIICFVLAAGVSVLQTYSFFA